MSNTYFKDLVLENDRALLRPMCEDDYEGLKKNALNDDVWKYYVMSIKNDDDLKAYLESSLKLNKNDQQHVFAIIDKTNGQLAGSTSFGNISLPDQRVEIGWTWLGVDYHGGGLNNHCKYLLLNYAFEDALLKRVEFKTDVLNEAARKALIKIGATEEGVLRSHTVMSDDRRRDTIYYSILLDEWDQVKDKLINMMSSKVEC